jgi:hypothetical protein
MLVFVGALDEIVLDIKHIGLAVLQHSVPNPLNSIGIFHK